MTDTLIVQLEAELTAINHQMELLQARRDGIRKVLDSYEGKIGTNRDISNGRLSTVAMARQILEENGSPMSTAEIRRAIQRKFNVAPASSLQQMLYTRARDERGFFNEDRKYGLLQWRRKK